MMSRCGSETAIRTSVGPYCIVSSLFGVKVSQKHHWQIVDFSQARITLRLSLSWSDEHRPFEIGWVNPHILCFF